MLSSPLVVTIKVIQMTSTRNFHENLTFRCNCLCTRKHTVREGYLDLHGFEKQLF